MSANMTLCEFFYERYLPHHIPYAAAATIKLYKVIIKQLKNHLGREPMLADLTEETFASLIAAQLKYNSPYTVDRTKSKLLALANYATKKRLLDESPDVPPIRICRKTPTSYTPTQIGSLIEAARLCKGMVGDVPANLFWPALFLVIYDTAARIGAVLHLQWTDYHAQEPFALLFRAETAKTHKEQLLRVSSETAEALERIRLPQRELIFAWPLTEATLYHRVKQLFAAAGLPNKRHDLFHRIRRTTLSLMHGLGGDATAQAGHCGDIVTRKHYLDTSNAKQAADILPRPTTSPGPQPEPDQPCPFYYESQSVIVGA